MHPTLVQEFLATIPAGTPKTAPVVVPTTFEPNVVGHIAWVFPPGCNGLVGIQLGARSVPVLPSGQGQFFTSSGDTHAIDVEGMHEMGDWSVIGYNTGTQPHTIRVRFTMRRHQIQEPPVRILPGVELSTEPPYAHLGWYADEWWQ
jgi:hypothetical protein